MSSRTIYSFPDIKEPEKTSSWSEEQRPGWKPTDHELEDAKARTEFLKQHMSPAGALGLPPLLDEHRLKYGIPDEAFANQACFDRIYVFPLDAVDGDANEKTAGGVLKPSTARLRDKQEGHRGVLISAGLTAADRLMSHGIELGHIVMTNKNVPYAHKVLELPKSWMFYLVMREADLAGSETLTNEIRAGKRRIIDIGTDTHYEHVIATKSDTGEWDISKKQSVFVQDTW